jgi:prepilin-type N-terminal cleavage/methylation domain-containing protein/prepilin-type processing-associated H-X9-DG protein
MNARPVSKRYGFTLMELLVVMGILALLVTIAVPASQRIGHMAKASHCMGNLRGLGSGLQNYLGDHNNELPTLVIARSSVDADQPAIDNTLDSYVGDKSIFCCKADAQGLCKKTGTSYLWNHLVNGQNIASMDFMGLSQEGTRIPLMSDKESFHKYRDVKVNILYADGHVAKEIQFIAAGQ